MLINTMVDVITLVRSKRIELGMTQDQLAHEVDMSRQWVRNLEGASEPPLFRRC